jgi:hypothetical protein
MSLSMYHASVPVFVRSLGNLRNLLDKGAASAEARKFDPSVLVNARLAPDMFPLSRQVQIAADFAKGTCARLAGVEVPKYEDTESSLAELQGRIDKTLAFIQSLPQEAIDGSEARDITLPIRGTPTSFKGQPYLLHFALPNFYFHMSIAYALLRHNGVDVGKMDFIGPAP